MQNIKYLFSICLVLLLFLTACQVPYLNVQTQYLTHENLASFYVGTPDPQLDHPIIGQKLMIQWSLPKAYVNQDVRIKLKVRFRNRKEEEIFFPLNHRRGSYVYSLLEKAYCETEGILTYKADLLVDGCEVDSWVHPLWTDLITFETNK